jgi:hypothetical protein
MSIAPVEGFPPSGSGQSGSGSAANAQLRSSGAAAGAQPVLGPQPKQENSAAPKVPATNELAQDVVEVHQDPEIKDQIIIEYLDQSKNVILQVPSQEELDFEHAVAQELQETMKLRPSQAAAAAGSPGNKVEV